jgi:hypothetical protein
MKTIFKVKECKLKSTSVAKFSNRILFLTNVLFKKGGGRIGVGNVTKGISSIFKAKYHHDQIQNTFAFKNENQPHTN